MENSTAETLEMANPIAEMRAETLEVEARTSSRNLRIQVLKPSRDGLSLCEREEEVEE